jgi:hypothetical protein
MQSWRISLEEGAKALVGAATFSNDGPNVGFFFDGKPSPGKLAQSEFILLCRPTRIITLSIID